MNHIVQDIKQQANTLLGVSEEQRTKALLKLAELLAEKTPLILTENAKDLAQAQEHNLNSALVDRLALTPERITAMIKGVQDIAEQPAVVGQIQSEVTRDDGLIIKKQRIPLGVVLMIFESRPNVIIDSAALAIKSANAIILKGGKEAYHSNKVLGQIVQEAIAKFMPKQSVTVLDSTDRALVAELLSMKEYIDIVIPRGGENLIAYVYEKATMPVIAHFKGLCHVYLDSDCDHDMALDIVINAKTQRTGVCNAMETLIMHKDLAPVLLPKVMQALNEKGTELKLDARFAVDEMTVATEEDWATEYLENILSIKYVNDIDEAIAHIQQYGSNHTEAIVSNNTAHIEKFQNYVDASCIMVNASTRFNDGSELGLGAELGISTTKLHAYGPMGAQEMTSLRHLVIGQGHVRQ